MKAALRIEQSIENEINDIKMGIDFDTPMTAKAFDKSDEEKMALIESSFKDIMDTLGLDLTDDSLKDTPRRVAKMYVKELFRGLNPENKPEVTLFDNKYNYGKMLVERNITLFSNCEHHFVPVYGKAHVAYFSNGKVIGLSKLNRLVDYYARRPQVQERLTVQILHELKRILKTEDVAVIIDAVHHCVCSRGVNDTASSTITAEYSGKFLNESTREELFRMINFR
ncbi:MAG: GTP cyclohydrolase I FolE [Bacteroidota bacterium]